MEIKNDKTAGGSEPRRFSAGRAAAKPGANAFALALKKAASQAVSDGPSARSDSAPALPQATQPAEKTSSPEATEPGPGADGKRAASEAENPADTDAAFADHMELVRFRLKTGYYASKAINDALSDKLSGYFDDLA